MPSLDGRARAYTEAMAPLPGRTAAILVADDDALVRAVLRMALVAHGHTVVEAFDAASVAEVDAQVPIAIAILDINMPGGTVHDSLDALAARRPMPAVLLLSGDDRPDAAVLARVAGLARKPIELDELHARVAALLSAAPQPEH
ncbi:response regulator [Microcella daejeonensis]|nr:response regulator [Microcella daejeonensis]WAB83036.1 response regulator [Microcella daejeonensis]